jgi:hypothetical protein
LAPIPLQMDTLGNTTPVVQEAVINEPVEDYGSDYDRYSYYSHMSTPPSEYDYSSNFSTTPPFTNQFQQMAVHGMGNRNVLSNWSLPPLTDNLPARVSSDNVKNNI